MLTATSRYNDILNMPVLVDMSSVGYEYKDLQSYKER